MDLRADPSFESLISRSGRSLSRGVPETDSGRPLPDATLERMTRYPNGNKPAPDYRSSCSRS